MNQQRAASRRRHDVVLYGATGFVGRQTVAYFARHAGALRWALGGCRARAAARGLRAGCRRRRHRGGGRGRRESARCARRADRRGAEHRRAVCPLWQRAGGGLCEAGLPLRRHHRRGALDARADRSPSRAGRARRYAHHPLLRLRLGAVRPGRVAGRASRVATTRRAVRERQGLPLDARRHQRRQAKRARAHRRTMRSPRRSRSSGSR